MYISDELELKFPKLIRAELERFQAELRLFQFPAEMSDQKTGLPFQRVRILQFTSSSSIIVWEFESLLNCFDFLLMGPGLLGYQDIQNFGAGKLMWWANLPPLLGIGLTIIGRYMS